MREKSDLGQLLESLTIGGVDFSIVCPEEGLDAKIIRNCDDGEISVVVIDGQTFALRARSLGASRMKLLVIHDKDRRCGDDAPSFDFWVTSSESQTLSIPRVASGHHINVYNDEGLVKTIKCIDLKAAANLLCDLELIRRDEQVDLHRDLRLPLAAPLSEPLPPPPAPVIASVSKKVAQWEPNPLLWERVGYIAAAPVPDKNFQARMAHSEIASCVKHDLFGTLQHKYDHFRAAHLKELNERLRLEYGGHVAAALEELKELEERLLALVIKFETAMINEYMRLVVILDQGMRSRNFDMTIADCLGKYGIRIAITTKGEWAGFCNLQRQVEHLRLVAQDPLARDPVAAMTTRYLNIHGQLFTIHAWQDVYLIDVECYAKLSFQPTPARNHIVTNVIG